MAVSSGTGSWHRSDAAEQTCNRKVKLMSQLYSEIVFNGPPIQKFAQIGRVVETLTSSNMISTTVPLSTTFCSGSLR